MSIYEASISNPKKQLEFYKDLSEQLQRENQQLIERFTFIKNRVKQGMSIENKNKCLIELGNSILEEIESRK